MIETKSDLFMDPPPYPGSHHEAAFDDLAPPNGSTSTLPQYNSLETYSSLETRFSTTRQLQIEKRGYQCSGFRAPSPEPVYIYDIGPDGQQGSQAYVSLRFSRNSNSCVLARAGDASETSLCSTTYRIGPYRPPLMKLPGFEEDIVAGNSSWNCLSRKIAMKTPLGTFRWRYGAREERRAANANSLLVLEQLSSTPTSDGKDDWQRVGQMVRNDEYRSRGTTRWCEGNGGRLMLDLSQWSDMKRAAEQVEVIAVASCLIMLKKECDNAQATGM
ncbi:hypothetical protein S40285_08400 [Stachybotrys chlorohalonatus IBT 40285]|uniref:Uncharacterized protein n=1 Tax=Stachybotrys chlorohalonatus (strain IBT 40285) TaxID=1283841 RepID=A0A084R366_STAC4|nr:hypothetical protein S40285_08400 [Stachybotrys chlorohalonata IBT 40285]